MEAPTTTKEYEALVGRTAKVINPGSSLYGQTAVLVHDPRRSVARLAFPAHNLTFRWNEVELVEAPPTEAPEARVESTLLVLCESIHNNKAIVRVVEVDGITGQVVDQAERRTMINGFSPGVRSLLTFASARPLPVPIPERLINEGRILAGETPE